jgi:hypothetical protein
MKRASFVAAAFSLIEVTLALGIAAFCLLAVFGLMPVGVQTNRNATSQTRATNIMAAVVSDLRATPKTNTWSLQFVVRFGSSATLYFDKEGRCSCDTAGLQKPNPLTGTCSLSWSPALQPVYQLDITWSGSTTLRYADLKVRWPPVFVQTTPTPVPSGLVEMFAAFDRN